MKARLQSKPALDLIEEATHLLRTAPAGTLALYYLGTAPFVLALLYFWADMSRNPFADQHLADAAFAVAALFVWMKFWQTLFARRVRARLAGGAPAPLRATEGFRLVVSQTTLQPLGLLPIGLCVGVSFYSPLPGLLLAIAVGGVLPLFYNITAVGDGTAETVRDVFKKSWRLWMLWPGQNMTLLVILYAFGFFVFLSLSIFCGSLPRLLETLFGVQSVFTQSPFSLLNSTFFAAMFGLAYLCVDPILKTVFTLRCFYGESLKSGEDLKAELKRFAVSAGAVALAMVISACGLEGWSFFEPMNRIGGRQAGSVRTDCLEFTLPLTPALSPGEREQLCRDRGAIESRWLNPAEGSWGKVKLADVRRRYATLAVGSCDFRGLKPTATIVAPLRGARMDHAFEMGMHEGRGISGVELLSAVPPHPGPMTRSLPLARPSRASRFAQIPFAASQAAQVPQGEGIPLSKSWVTQDGETQTSDGVVNVSSGTENVSSPETEQSRTGTTTIGRPKAVSSPDLDHAIDQTIHERKYTWRMPREAVAKDTKQGAIGRFIDKVADMIRNGLRAAIEWLRDLLRKLFPRRSISHSYQGSGIDWMTLSQALLFVLITVVLCALAIFIYRLWQGRTRLDAVATEPVQMSVPDISDENVGADQMPEDGWTRLGRELLERGEFRLALRAFYLASLAHLAQRSLITLARFKSNHDYERELRRRGHSFPDLLSIFGDNLPVFERIWYGRHGVDGEMVNDFAAKVERMKGAA